MHPAPCISVRPTLQHQQGMSLLEALITLIIMAILGIGLAYVSGRASVSQRYMNSQNLAVGQMRFNLQTTTCAASANISIASSTVSTPCVLQASAATLTAQSASGTTIASGSVTVSVPSVSTVSGDNTANQLFGGQIKIDSSQQ